MTKRPGEFEPREPLTKAEREARKVFRQVEATKAMTEHEQAGRAFNENRERLRTERRARETVKELVFSPTPELPDDTPIDKVRFATRIRTALIAAGWKTVGEIREASDATLLSLQDLGKGSVAHLRKTLGLPSEEGVRPQAPKAKGQGLK
jgi:DNA-directed RNA polymerase alpha subunit